MKPIQMADLVGQYHHIKDEVNDAWQEVLENASFINGPQVKSFCDNLANYLGVKHVIPCANGTDALEIALMALDLPKGSEIITPSFSYAALTEVIMHLGFKPVFVEVDPHTFTMDIEAMKAAITPNTKVLAPVHLYGQCANMNKIMEVAKKHGLCVIEDTAQSIGANYKLTNGNFIKAGTIGDIGTTSFFPSKNLGCYGDGGAIFTNNDELAVLLRMIVNHGQEKKYVHKVIGMNSRLDSLQAAVLDIKLKYLDQYAAARNEVANYYDRAFAGHPNIKIPARQINSEHVFHQYTLTLCGVDRDDLKQFLADNNIPSMIYYPIPLHKQEAYAQNIDMPLTEQLTKNVISLPISTEMEEEQLAYIAKTILSYPSFEKEGMLLEKINN